MVDDFTVDVEPKAFDKYLFAIVWAKEIGLYYQADVKFIEKHRKDNIIVTAIGRAGVYVFNILVIAQRKSCSIGGHKGVSAFFERSNYDKAIRKLRGLRYACDILNEVSVTSLREDRYFICHFIFNLMKPGGINLSRIKIIPFCLNIGHENLSCIFAFFQHRRNHDTRTSEEHHKLSV